MKKGQAKQRKLTQIHQLKGVALLKILLLGSSISTTSFAEWNATQCNGNSTNCYIGTNQTINSKMTNTAGANTLFTNDGNVMNAAPDQEAINNQGAISSFTNNGVIQGGPSLNVNNNNTYGGTGVSNSGTINTFYNNGAIIGTSFSLQNSGTITSLRNDGSFIFGSGTNYGTDYLLGGGAQINASGNNGKINVDSWRLDVDKGAADYADLSKIATNVWLTGNQNELGHIFIRGDLANINFSNQSIKLFAGSGIQLNVDYNISNIIVKNTPSDTTNATRPDGGGGKVSVEFATNQVNNNAGLTGANLIDGNPYDAIDFTITNTTFRGTLNPKKLVSAVVVGNIASEYVRRKLFVEGVIAEAVEASLNMRDYVDAFEAAQAQRAEARAKAQAEKNAKGEIKVTSSKTKNQANNQKIPPKVPPLPINPKNQQANAKNKTNPQAQAKATENKAATASTLSLSAPQTALRVRHFHVFALPYYSYSKNFSAGNVTVNSGGFIAGMQYKTQKAGAFGVYIGYERSKSSSLLQQYLEDNNVYYGLNHYISFLRSERKAFYVRSMLEGSYIGSNIMRPASIAGMQMSNGKTNIFSYGFSANLGMNIYLGKRNTLTPEIGFGYQGYSIGDYTIYVGTFAETYKASMLNLVQPSLSLRYEGKILKNLIASVRGGAIFNALPYFDAKYDIGGVEGSTENKLPIVYGTGDAAISYMPTKDINLSLHYGIVGAGSFFSNTAYFRFDWWF